MKKLIVLILLLLAGPAGAAVEGTWTSLGPEGGDAVSLAVSPDRVLLAGLSNAGGLFRSSDGGESWSRTGGELGHQSILAVAADPVRPKLVYAGTWNGFFRSIDGGRTWARSNQGLPSYSGQPAEVRALAVDPRQPRRVFALSGGGLYLSRNQGRSWELLLQSYAEAFAIAPSDPRVLYVLESFGRGRRSTDGGLTWTPMNLGFYGYDAFFLAVHPTDPELVWAAVHIESRGPALLRSEDGGRSWEPVWIHRKIRTLLADPRDPETLWAGAEGGILRIFGRGTRWRFFPVSAGEGVLSLAFDPAGRQVLYAGTGWNERTSRGAPGRQGGVWRSSDRGKTWQQTVRGMIATEVTAAVAPAPGRIVAGVRGRGPMLGSGSLFDWVSGAQGIEGNIEDLLANPADPDRLWAATSNGVFRSEDGGRTWAWSSEGLTGGSLLPDRIVFTALALDPSAPDGLWAAGWGGLFRSADGGRTWSRIASLPDRALASLAVDPRDGQRLWVTFSGGGAILPAVLRSEDGGTTWHTTSFLSYWLGPVAVGPTGTVLASTLNRLVRSSDGGATWQEAPLSGVFSIVPDPADPDTVWAAGLFGLHRSRDGGATWEGVTGGPVLPVVLDLEWESPGRLLLATQGGGLFRFVPND